MSWDRSTAQVFPSLEVTQLHLFRHGKVDTGGQRLAYGHSDYPLTAEGTAQGEALRRFAAEHFPEPDGVLSSDLRRCADIARPLAEELGVPLRLLPELREQHMGLWEGRPWAELTDEDVARVRDYWTDYAGTRPPEGETYREMAARVQGWLKDDWEAIRGKRWLVVSHIGPIRALCCQFLGVPIDQALRFAPVYASHTWFQLAEAGAVLQVMGERTASVDMGPAAVARAERAGAGGLDRPPRIALSGSAGTGKTTLGRSLAEHYDVPYLPEGMRGRIEGGLKLHDLSHLELRTLVEELWVEQVSSEERAIAEHGGFVADRSPVDYAAFWLHYHFSEYPQETEAFFASSLGRVDQYDRLVVLPWGALPLVADGVRSSNPWIQRGYQSLLEGLHQREVRPDLLAWMPPLTELDARVAWVLDQLEEAGVRGQG